MIFDSSPLQVRAGQPDVYPVLAIYMQLEALVPDHQPGLMAAADLIDGWIGSHLAISHVDELEMMAAYSRQEFGFMTAMPERLAMESVARSPEFGELEVLADAPCSFALTMQGSRTNASPFSVVFDCEVGEPLEPTAAVYPSRAALRVTVPTDWPLADFYERVLALAGLLDVRWGNAGLSYSGQEIASYQASSDVIHRHARRYPGFDVGFYATHLGDWHHAIRTVNWLTLVGSKFCPMTKPDGRGAVEVRQYGGGWLLLAGAEPSAGDVNRLSIARGYVVADQIVRSVRASTGINFCAPWTEGETSRWLRRFEMLWQ